MSWLFSQALVMACANSPSSPAQAVASSVANSLGGTQCVLWKTTAMQPGSWLDGRTTAASRLFRSGVTLRPLPDAHGEALLTLCQEASRARTSVPPARAPAWLVRAVASGESSPASSPRYSPSGASSRTVPSYARVGSPSSSATLPPWGMMLHGECSVQTPWVPPTSGSACGSWPTPTVHGNYNRKGLSPKSGDGLATAVYRVTWPTPCASEGKDCGTSWALLSTFGPNSGRLQRTMAFRGMPETQLTEKAILNPAWTEWLLGWPIGWTDSSASAMARYQQWRHSHGCTSADNS